METMTGIEEERTQFEQFPNSMKQLLRKAQDSSDLEGFQDLVTTEIWKT